MWPAFVLSTSYSPFLSLSLPTWVHMYVVSMWYETQHLKWRLKRERFNIMILKGKNCSIDDQFLKDQWNTDQYGVGFCVRVCAMSNNRTLHVLSKTHGQHRLSLSLTHTYGSSHSLENTLQAIYCVVYSDTTVSVSLLPHRDFTHLLHTVTVAVACTWVSQVSYLLFCHLASFTWASVSMLTPLYLNYM